MLPPRVVSVSVRRRYKGWLFGFALFPGWLASGTLGIQPTRDEPYFPPKGDAWQTLSPKFAGFDAKKLELAVEYAKAHESDHPRDFSNQQSVFGRLLGPIPKQRSGTKGLIVRGGFIVAEWGDTSAVEPTYSVAKSFLSTIAGVAADRKFISTSKPVGETVKDGGYDSPHNAKVTWSHHLQQSSEWQGELWGKNADFLDEKEFGQGRMRPREVREPGTRFEYNDVRINRLALSLLRVFGQPLSEVLREAVMEPIGASDTWKYLGYDNSWVEIGGRTIQSVTGGTRWGGGLWISARDQARFGLLFLRGGRWKGKQVISREWIEEALRPSPTNANYGYLWWLNTAKRQWPALSEKAFAAMGYGSNTIWVDPERDLVIVWRWHANPNEFLRMVVEAIES